MICTKLCKRTVIRKIFKKRGHNYNTLQIKKTYIEVFL